MLKYSSFVLVRGVLNRTSAPQNTITKDETREMAEN